MINIWSTLRGRFSVNLSAGRRIVTGFAKRLIEGLKKVDDRSLELVLAGVRKGVAILVLLLALLIPHCTGWAASGADAVPMSRTMAFAACLATIASAVVAVLHLRSRRETDRGRHPRDVGSVWLGAFAMVLVVGLIERFAARLPQEIETSWVRRAVPYPGAKACYKVCTDPKQTMCKVIDGSGSAC